MTAYTGGAMQIWGWDLPVVIDLAGMEAEAPLPILLDHNPGAIVGHAEAIEKTTATLKLSGLISGANPSADQVAASAAAGFPWRASVGARPDRMETVRDGRTAQANGRTFKGPIYVARKSVLGEVSFVAVAADSKTRVTVAATAAQSGDHAMDFEEWIEAMGLAVADLREDQVAKLRADYDSRIKATGTPPAAAGASGSPAATPPANPPPIQAAAFDLNDVEMVSATYLAKIEATAAKYSERVPADKAAPFTAAAKAANLEVKAKAIAEQWPKPRLEAEYVKSLALFEADLIRAERPKAPAIHSSSIDVNLPIMQAAFCRSCGLKNMEKHFPADVLEASEKKLRNMGLQELLLIQARAAGYDGRQRISRENLKEVLQAAFSTHTITTLLTSADNKMLLDGFNAVPQLWREVGVSSTVSDFKTVTAYRLTATLEYEELGPAGEIQHGTLGQDSYTKQAKTYARMLSLTRQDIINDDLGAFNGLRTRLGMGAVMKMNKVFWTLWLAQSNAGTFWTAARGNLVTSSSLGDTGIATAVQAFRDMTGPDGNLLGLEPDRILVPPALEATARKWYTSQEIRDTTANTRIPTANIWQNRFRPIVVAELGNSAYTGYSATTWYLAANPAILATAGMCFLDGQEAPTIEDSDADFETLGIQLRGYHDFGAYMAEYRASVQAQA